jgi:hypothetical protein
MLSMKQTRKMLRRAAKRVNWLAGAPEELRSHRGTLIAERYHAFSYRFVARVPKIRWEIGFYEGVN